MTGDFGITLGPTFNLALSMSGFDIGCVIMQEPLVRLVQSAKSFIPIDCWDFLGSLSGLFALIFHSTVKLWIVVCRYVSPGLRTVDGNFDWFGESG